MKSVGKAAVVLGAALMVAASFGSGFSQGQDRVQPTLLGLNLDEVISRFGPPEQITQLGGQAMALAYRDSKGELHERALTLSGDRVFLMDDSLEEYAAPPPRLTAEVYLGQSLVEAARVLGTSGEVQSGSLTSKVVYPNGVELTVFEGRIIGLQQP